MQKFSKVSGVAAPIELSNIDTDMIIPKQFLKTIKRSGLGEGLFYEMRYDENGVINENFILNKNEFAKSKIILAYENFGCGSSREHAPWALKDFGVSVIIAISYADIFYNNCFKNGILPISLDKKNIDFLIQNLPNAGNQISVDLENQSIVIGNNSLNFEIDPHKKECLMNGWDDIDLTLKHLEEINNYETNNQNKEWVNIKRDE